MQSHKLLLEPHCLKKKITRVLSLLMIYDTRAENISYTVLSCVIYTIIKIYVCIDYLAFQSKQLSEIPVGYGRGYKHGDRRYPL